MDILTDDATCRLEVDREALARADRLVVAFSGIGPGKRPKGVPPPEFIGSAARYGAPVCIGDKTRSWGNRLDIAGLSRQVLDLAQGRPIFTLGNSMGGFLAILFSTPLRAARTVAVAAQYSVCPQIIPSEHRWDHFALNIGPWWYPSLLGRFNPVTAYVTLNGSIWQEKRHWSRFPHQPNTQHYVFDSFGHDVAIRLKQAGALSPVLDHAFLGDATADLPPMPGLDATVTRLAAPPAARDLAIEKQRAS